MLMDVTYACGHRGTVDVYGNNTEECERKVRDIEERWLCPECAAHERAERNARAARANAEAGLPQLVGTESQIPWTETVRFEALADMRQIADDVIAQYGKGSREAIAAMEAYQFMAENDNADYWLNNRKGGALIREFEALVNFIVVHDKNAEKRNRGKRAA